MVFTCIKILVYKNVLLELTQTLNFKYAKIVQQIVELALVQNNMNVLVAI